MEYMEVSEMLRHAPLSSVAGLLSDLRGHDNVKTTQIYDGRRSLGENQIQNKNEAAKDEQQIENPGMGEIIYFRDSDDEMPYSDEEPDYDLDIF
ncbi:hypothetical protein LIER_28950 [Lithospermum erythrorhizon]|uniref:Elongator complex protein 5 n=1 Tax=Lithospermum erythrorhizon TaxID=34254 RepID=A0AAV3RJ16_LITER